VKRVAVPEPERLSEPPVVTCDYARCAKPATIALRFGDGSVRVSIKFRQSYAFYCDAHAKAVRRMFVTCDERPLAELYGVRARDSSGSTGSPRSASRENG